MRRPSTVTASTRLSRRYPSNESLTSLESPFPKVVALQKRGKVQLELDISCGAEHATGGHHLMLNSVHISPGSIRTIHIDKV